jgi:hypothetical protein
MLGIALPIHNPFRGAQHCTLGERSWRRINRRHPVECGGLPPLSAVRACPDVLHAFDDATDCATQPPSQVSAGKLPKFATRVIAASGFVGARHAVPGADAWHHAADPLMTAVRPNGSLRKR